MRFQLKHKRAFTLMELLVVISIIALLMAILTPSLQKARELAKSVVCKSNLHQVGTATMCYLAANEGRFFEFLPGTSTSVQEIEFGQGGIPAYLNVKSGDPGYLYYKARPDWRPINQFIKQYDVWKCPSDKGLADNPDHPLGPDYLLSQGWVTWGEPIWSFPRQGASYMFNSAGIPKLWGENGYLNPNRNVASVASRIPQSSEFVLFYEFPFWDFNLLPFEPGHDRVVGNGWGWGGAGNFHERRSKPATANVVFADGHAKRLSNFTGKGESDPGNWKMLP